MPNIKFRFATECELTLTGDSYEEIYLTFKDLCHGDQSIEEHPDLKVFPPEDCKIYFEVDSEPEYCEIDMLKGDFIKDIVDNCPSSVAKRIMPSGYH